MRPSFRGVVWFAWGGVALLLAATAILGLYDAPERAARQPAASISRRPAPPTPARRRPPLPPPAPRARPSRPASTSSRSIAAARPLSPAAPLPGDRVRVLDGDTPIGEVSADSRGEWVLVPETPIAPGDRQLARRGHESRDGGARPPLARYRRAVGAAARQGAGRDRRRWPCCCPASRACRRASCSVRRIRAGNRKLSLDAAEYGGPDQLVLSGNAEPGARLNIYAGGQLLGSATADECRKMGAALGLSNADRRGRTAAGPARRRRQRRSPRRRAARPAGRDGAARRRDLCRRARQQPVADRPPRLWPGHALHRDLRGQPGHDPRSAIGSIRDRR